MITIQGKSKQKGIAIAAAAVVNIQTGINGISQELLREGVSALSKGYSPEDYPEVVVVCDTILTGSSIKIPGVRTIGIAAEQDLDIPSLDLDIPCIFNLPELMKSIMDDVIVIVDGDKGVIYIDPDPPTLMSYQQKENRHSTKPAIFIESEHLPAKTQSGEIITVYALVSNEAELIGALNNGADGIIIEPWNDEGTAFYNSILHLAAGKPVVFKDQYLDIQLLQAIMRMATPHQVTVLFYIQEYDEMLSDAEIVLENAIAEAFINDLEPPVLNIGAYTRDNELIQAENSSEINFMYIDIHKSKYLGALKDELMSQVPLWINGMRSEDVIFGIDDKLNVVINLIKTGAKNIAVNYENVSKAKFIIRSIGMEDME